MAASPIGVAGEVALVKFGRQTRQIESTPSLTNVASKIVGNNPDRVELLVVNAGTDLIAFSLNKSLTTASGVRLPPGGTAILSPDEDGELTGYEIWGIANSGTQALYVLEIVADL